MQGNARDEALAANARDWNAVLDGSSRRSEQPMHAGVRYHGRRSCTTQLAVDEHCSDEGQDVPRSRAGQQVPGLPRMLGPQH